MSDGCPVVVDALLERLLQTQSSLYHLSLADVDEIYAVWRAEQTGAAEEFEVIDFPAPPLPMPPATAGPAGTPQGFAWSSSVFAVAEDGRPAASGDPWRATEDPRAVAPVAVAAPAPGPRPKAQPLPVRRRRPAYRYYTVTRVPRGMEDRLGVWTATWRTVAAALQLPDGGLEGSQCHARGFNHVPDAIGYWVSEGWELPAPRLP